MMNCYVVRRGQEYLARKGTKSARSDGWFLWSRETQAARTYRNIEQAHRRAKEVGGVVRIMRNGRVED